MYKVYFDGEKTVREYFKPLSEIRREEQKERELAQQAERENQTRKES